APRPENSATGLRNPPRFQGSPPAEGPSAPREPSPTLLSNPPLMPPSMSMPPPATPPGYGPPGAPMYAPPAKPQTMMPMIGGILLVVAAILSIANWGYIMAVVATDPNAAGFMALIPGLATPAFT